MARPRKSRIDDLPAQSDPRAPLDASSFLHAARPVLRALTDDLLTRADADPGIRAALEQHHQKDLAASRTADDYAVWRRGIVVQVAAAWLLSCVFVRVLEDRGLVRVRIAGAGARDSETAFFRITPSLGEREYLQTVFRELTRLPAAAPLFDREHNLVWRLGPSAEGCKQLLQLFRAPHPDAPAFRFGQPDTRFLGDLYQDLDDGVRERFALLQTPDFVEQFILDRTLEPAIQEYGIDHTDMIDPTCGSGHFLLGAFGRIFAHLRDAHPVWNDRKLAAATLERIYGVDINPYAVSIARFRLTLQFLESGGYERLRENTPAPALNVIVADSLYYGFTGQGDLAELPDQTPAQAAEWHGPGFSLEDPAATYRILVNKTYAAVVGNPPYIAVKDPVLREVYRKNYTAAAGKYALTAPFMQRFFQLAKVGGGYVGQITSNSFAKREFGAALIEKVLPTLDLALIINTSGAYIPWHGTPTMLVFGRNRSPSKDHTDAVLARRGEPHIPPDPAKGLVWRSIIDHWDREGFENEFISVVRIPLHKLRVHPWSLEGGASGSLKHHLDGACIRQLSHMSTVGVFGMTNADDCMFLSRSQASRTEVESQLIRPTIVGEQIRDWSQTFTNLSIFPYDPQGVLIYIENAPFLKRHLWPYRRNLEARATFGGGTYLSEGAPWWKWHQISHSRAENLTITFAFIGSHNHFYLNRNRAAFGRSAPIIKLFADTEEDALLGLLAYLNSSTTCFYIKQITYPKGTRNGDASEDNHFEFSAAAVGSLPVPDSGRLKTLIPFARLLEKLQAERDHLNPTPLLQAILARGDALEPAVTAAKQKDTALWRRMVAVQEDLDWAVYALFELTPHATAARWTENLELASEQRPFNAPFVPEHLGPVDRELWRARAAAIAASKQLQLLETPAYKRRWWAARTVLEHDSNAFTERVADAAAEMIADLAEDLLRARCARSIPTVFTARDLERELDADPRYHALRDWLVTRDPARDPLRDQLERESVPFLAGYRYSPAGRDRHARWREVWDLQRIADVSEAALPALRDAFERATEAARQATAQVAEERSKLAGAEFELAAPPPRRGRARKQSSNPPPGDSSLNKSPALLAAEARQTAALAAQSSARTDLELAESHHRKVRQLIPVPSKYEPGDFRSPNYYRLRGKLDVPRERFVSYPEANSDSDPAPVYGWAGWNHLQRALALLQLFYHRKLEEGWTAERLVPLLAGLEELYPWVKQWHSDERHADTGERYVDALDAHINTGCTELGITRAQLPNWAPPDLRQRRARSTHASANINTPRQHAPNNAGTPDLTLLNKRRPRKPAHEDAPTDAPPNLSNPPAKKRRGRPSKSEVR